MRKDAKARYKSISLYAIAAFLSFVLTLGPSFNPVFAAPLTIIQPWAPDPAPAPFVPSRLSLNDFIQEVLANNPAIQAAKANVVAASDRQRAAAQPIYNPELTVQMQDATDRTEALGINQTMDLANKREARTAVGTANLQVAEAELKTLQQQLTAKVLDALVRYQYAQQIFVLAQEKTGLLKQFVELTEKRLANGDVARVDVDLAQLALSEALAQQADAQVNVSQALQTLRATTGLMDTVAWPRLPRQFSTLTLSPTAIDQLVNQLPLIQILDNQYLSATARIHLAQRARYPDPTVGFQGGKEDTNEGNSAFIGVTVSIPIFVRNSYSAEVDAANEDAIETEQKRLDLIRQTRADIVSSAERYNILYQAAGQWQQISNKPLSEGMVLIERLWRAGEINTTDYLVQLKQRIDSQIAGVELQERTWQAWIGWLNASGTFTQWLQPQQTPTQQGQGHG